MSILDSVHCTWYLKVIKLILIFQFTEIYELCLENVKEGTFVLTERGLETMNLKNCGRYFRSLSPSL